MNANHHPITANLQQHSQLLHAANGLPMINLAAATTTTPAHLFPASFDLSTQHIQQQIHNNSTHLLHGDQYINSLFAGNSNNMSATPTLKSHHIGTINNTGSGGKDNEKDHKYLSVHNRTMSMSEIQPQLIPPPPMIERQSKTNLYIKGLPENFTDEELERLVPDKTKIKSLKAALEEDYRCKGYGFVDFVTEEDAKFALEYIQNHYPHFNAKYAKENEKDKTNLYVTNIPKEWTSKDSDKLKTYFEKFGPIQSAFIMIEKSTNKTVGVGFVRFVSENDALEALEKLEKGQDYLPNCDRPIEAKYADKHNPETRKRRNPGGPITAGNGLSPASGSSASMMSNSLLAAVNAAGMDQYLAAAAVRNSVPSTSQLGNCLINPNLALAANSLYGTLYPSSHLMVRGLNPQTTPQGHPSGSTNAATAAATTDTNHPYNHLQMTDLAATQNYQQQLYQQILAGNATGLDPLFSLSTSNHHTPSITSASAIDLYSYSQIMNQPQHQINKLTNPTPNSTPINNNSTNTPTYYQIE